MTIPVIDLFAGPGGLGEGFSTVTDNNGNRAFDIKLSIEKDPFAHQTLELRSFLRQFPVGQFPEEYYNMVRENIPEIQKELKQKLFDGYPAEYEIAKNEAWLCELGHPDFSSENVDYRIRKALNKEKEWVLIGGPPCQAYSLVGRSRNRGISEEDTRVFLYREYLRIIAKHHPAIFVMENVKGLLSAKLDGTRIFEWIKRDLKNPGVLFPKYNSPKYNSPKYRLYSFVKVPDHFDGDEPIYLKDEDFLIKTEKYGIPQNRHRVILLGVREDLGRISYNPLEAENQVNLQNIIGNLPKLRSGISKEISGLNINGKNRYGKINDSEEIWNKVTGEYFNKVKLEFGKNQISFEPLSGLTRGENFKEIILNEQNNPLLYWYFDPRLGGIINHETRTHLKEDLGRYLFSSLYLQSNRDFPKLRDYPKWLLPNHKNALGGKFADRFRTQRSDQPATTVTSHISKDGHYFIHYDPAQCRSLTVREAARIQTFPDNYFFCGTRTQQYHQVGNAVPAFFAYKIGYISRNILNEL